MMVFPERIELQNITLRWLRTNDANAFFENYTQDLSVAKFLRWRVHKTPEETFAFIQERVSMREKKSGCYWAITLNTEDRPVGMIGARIAGHEINLGYGLSAAHWGQGIMTEAVRGVLKWAWAQPEIEAVTASCDRENTLSARVLEKSGFQKDPARTALTIRPNIGDTPRPKDMFVIKRNRRPVIREATPQDSELLAQLSRQTFVETFADQNSEENMSEYLAKHCTAQALTDERNEPSAVFFIAEAMLEPVGFAKIRNVEIPKGLENIRAIEIHRLYILKKMIGQKIGQALMEECLKQARADHYQAIWLGVWERNERAIAFYKKFGFEVFGSHIFEVGHDPQTDLLMKRMLII